MLDDPFLAAIEQQPQDLALRRVYADWLEEQGDPRAEFLRVELALADLREGEPGYLGLTADKERLRGQIDVEWQKQLGYYVAAERDAQVDSSEYCWAFRCPQQWNGLRPTEDANVRYCTHCQTHVHYCASPEEVERHASLRHCVAVARPETYESCTVGLMDYSAYERLEPPEEDIVAVNNPE